MIDELAQYKRITAKRVHDCLMNNYAGVCAFHACRPISVESYYRDGLRISNSKELDLLAKRLFFGPTPNVEAEQLFSEAVEQLGKRDDGKLYLSLDGRSLVRRSGHYLIYGSERLLCLAAHLGTDAERFRDVLRNSGVPTLFRVRLWWSDIEECDIVALAQRIAQNMRYVKSRDEPPVFMFSVTLQHSIKADAVLDHSFPREIADPMRKNIIYTHGLT
jgi:hypothetical protein